MIFDDSISKMLTPLETHVKTQVKHLRAVATVVQELQTIEEQYANDYAKLPFDIPVEVAPILKQLPQLRTVCSDFSLFLCKSSVVKACAAKELTKEVIAPLEAFTTEHMEKTQHLLSELYELLQREKAFNVAYENLHESCKTDQDTEDESGLQLHQTHMQQLLRKRDAERHAIQQWIIALHFAGQRYEAHIRSVLRHILSVYSRMIASLAALVSELQTQLTCDTSGVNLTRSHGDNNSSAESEEFWEPLVVEYDCHVAITSWMSELFKQMIPVERKTAKALQKVVKLDRTMTKTFGGVFSPRLVGLIDFHGLLLVNIADPIMRTLKFSRERQERMRKEMSKSLEESQGLVVNARSRLDAKMGTTKQQTEEESPIRSDSMTSSELSECCVDDNNQQESDISLQKEMSGELKPEKARLATAERKLTLQRKEIARVFEQTSFLSVKTMELMVQDHVKHVIKALTVLTETTHNEIPETKGMETAPQPWDHITEQFAIGVADQPASQNEKSQISQEIERCCSQSKEAKPREIRLQRETRPSTFCISEPSAIPVTLSFVQSAVGRIVWAAQTGLKTANYYMPHTLEERVLLATIVVTIITMMSICIRSSELQDDWSDLTNIQQLNSEVMMDLVKLSLSGCEQQVGAAAVPPSM